MVRSLLPVGGTLPVDTWESRHRGIRTLLWLPVPGLFLFALARGKSRRRAERALRSSQARTQSILAAANDAFVEMDVSGVITDWNRSAEVMFGWTSQEAVGRVLSETIIPVEFRPMHEAGFRRFLATGEGPRLGPRVQVPVLHRDGHQFPAELSVWLTGEPGNYSFNAFVQDITEEKRDQEKLQETLSLLGATLEATADGLLVVDRSGRMTSSNRKFAEMWGLPASVIESGDADAAVAAAVPHLEDPDAFVGEIRRMADLPEAESHDTLRFRDGRVFERYSKPQRVDGVAVGRVWSFHDVSDLKALEVDLAEARDRALESSRVKSEFLATMSHEIRTPMNGVIGLTGLLLDSDLDESQRQYAEGVQASGEALLGLINDVLDLSKVEAGKLDIEMVDFDLIQALDDVVALVAEPARAKSLELVVDCPPHLPATVCGDVGRLRQVLLNLLSNAIKFTDAGEVVLRASTVGAAGPDRVTMRFEVADTGIGIDFATTERLFEPFSQADASTTRRYGGTGLGLAICRRMAEAMGGSVGVESRLGHGSTFWLNLPLGLPAEPIRAASPGGNPLRGLKVLVVDDNETCRLALACHLLAWDITADVVSNAYVAIEHLRAEAESRPYDLALIDMGMPGMGGLELAQRVIADPALSSVKMLLLSAETVPTATVTAAGFAARLTKPVRATELYHVLLRSVAPPVVGTREAQASAPSPPVGSKGRLLIVEDNVVNQAVAKGVVANLGYRCDIAANGIDALQALQRRHYDAVLMDCQMPEMDGFQATEEIRRLRDGTEAVPVIAMTASALQEDRNRCLAAGMDDFLSKPVRRAELDQMLDKWLTARSCDPPPTDRTLGEASCTDDR